MTRVRRLARREVARGALLSDDPAWRSVQLRFLGVGLFLALSFLALAHGKLLRLFGTVVVVGEVLLGGLVLALVVWSRVKAQRPPAEPVDVELELSAADVERRLLEDLRPSDLIYERERWMTLLESAQFGDAAAVPSARWSAARGPRWW